ncbi:hypothetical protein [Mongoliitalea lutea]|uniref:Uncharacterized protein n=1 Tax=Mongoliitalea lutea TaxID=849756 RepID=A0A8J3CTY1_9BACT|nr:hypothetical protein [Mongoliitalea lutea]GHB23541.1 hypothetical protein GCM10008106_00050 [Mongoliitalea lutea]
MKSTLMKNYLPLLFLGIILLFNSACDREDDRPDYFYSFSVDGVEKNHRANRDANIVFIDDSQNNIRLTTWTMVTGNNTERNAIVIALRTIERLELGFTYQMQVPIVVNSVTSPSIAFFYLDENGKAWGALNLESLNPGTPENASIRLVDFSAEGTTGVFDGVLVDMEDDRPLNQRRTIQITNGRFFLPNFVENI